MRVTPQILKTLKAAQEEQRNTSFLLELKQPSGTTPEDFEKLGQSLLRRAQLSSGVTPERVDIYRRLGQIAVLAQPALFEHLLKMPEVTRATPTEPLNESMTLIRPVRTGPATKSGWT